MADNKQSGAFSDLISLLDVLSRSRSRADLTWLGKYLATIVDRPAPFSYSYLVSTLRDDGAVPPSRFLKSAVLIALVHHAEDVPLHIASAERYEIIGPAGADLHGVYVNGAVLVCAYPECPARFLKTHPRLKYCPIHRTKRRSK